MIYTDYLVIGSGIAGLTYAIKIASRFPTRNVTIITKMSEEESNTKYAQGGVAVVLNRTTDSFEKHISDTLIAGDGLCDASIVKLVVKEGPELLQELINWGASFDTGENGEFDLGREGGHSEYRVLHHKDSTGYEIEKTLLQQIDVLPNITLLTHHFAIDLITEHQVYSTAKNIQKCFGVYVFDQKTNAVKTIKAGNTLLASGGIGQVYGHTTNPAIATGDGIAMAYRAKANIQDMEFIQFHPTAMYSKNKGASFLISEAVRGFGAFLRNVKGERFMLQYDTRGELASRDIVSQCIDKELKKTATTYVFLDCTHLEVSAFKKHFPMIYEKCIECGIDIKNDWIPVIPASHYVCGGIVVDENGKTSLDNLYACGECSRTGLHGANRLASNSLLEALVFADRVYKHHTTLLPETMENIDIPDWVEIEIPTLLDMRIIEVYRKNLQKLMRQYAGIVRSNKELEIAVYSLAEIYKKVEKLYKHNSIHVELCELRNMINVAHMIITQSIARKENRGGYYNKDLVTEKITR
ncbi:L-aspartate oxidase [Aquimarina sp. TRL1]|uniref:L-aspartate oxidase n=1 Tax=Aquimarina sp. (strain TRL1) TaxID=2736252 RepID=UPI0015895993|nr:L-aspartate oxidase [Aquimarina sp. TRL1]QKX07064.1 L-aspartate oxidase [Aquimarina sp. TRL1]